MMNKTFSAKPDEVTRKWYVVDLDGLVLGRAASRIASILRGKNKPEFTPHVDVGDFVIVINAAKVKLTGNKWITKQYHKHSGYIGGLKTTSAAHMRDSHPNRIIEFAVKGMLPKNKIGDRLLKKLKIYTGPEHDHQAQSPEKIDLMGSK
jgi:large subunit ribosomal protein L13